MSRKTFDFDILKWDESSDTDEKNWYLEGYITNSNVDSEDDFLTDAALSKVADQIPLNSTMLYNHNIDQPIGKIVASEKRPMGVWVRAYISKTVPNIWQQVKEGIIKKFSIRFRPLRTKTLWHDKLKKYVNAIDDLLFKEASLVTVAMNQTAVVSSWYEKYWSDDDDLEEESKMEDSVIRDILESALEDKKGEPDDSTSLSDLFDKADQKVGMPALIQKTLEDALTKNSVDDLKNAIKAALKIVAEMQRRYPYPYPYPKPQGKYPYPYPYPKPKDDEGKDDKTKEFETKIKDLETQLKDKNAELEKANSLIEEMSQAITSIKGKLGIQ